MSTGKITRQIMEKAVREYKYKHSFHFVLFKDLNPKQAGNALKHIAPKVKPETAVALMDITVFSNGKKGLLLAEDGLYFADKPFFIQGNTSRKWIPMDGLCKVEPSTDIYDFVNFYHTNKSLKDGTMYLFRLSCSIYRDDILNLFRRMLELAAVPETVPASQAKQAPAVASGTVSGSSSKASVPKSTPVPERDLAAQLISQIAQKHQEQFNAEREGRELPPEPQGLESLDQLFASLEGKAASSPKTVIANSPTKPTPAPVQKKAAPAPKTMLKPEPGMANYNIAIVDTGTTNLGKRLFEALQHNMRSYVRDQGTLGDPYCVIRHRYEREDRASQYTFFHMGSIEKRVDDLKKMDVVILAVDNNQDYRTQMYVSALLMIPESVRTAIMYIDGKEYQHSDDISENGENMKYEAQEFRPKPGTIMFVEGNISNIERDIGTATTRIYKLFESVKRITGGMDSYYSAIPVESRNYVEPGQKLEKTTKVYTVGIFGDTDYTAQKLTQVLCNVLEDVPAYKGNVSNLNSGNTKAAAFTIVCPGSHSREKVCYQFRQYEKSRSVEEFMADVDVVVLVSGSNTVLDFETLKMLGKKYKSVLAVMDLDIFSDACDTWAENISLIAEFWDDFETAEVDIRRSMFVKEDAQKLLEVFNQIQKLADMTKPATPAAGNKLAPKQETVKTAPAKSGAPAD